MWVNASEEKCREFIRDALKMSPEDVRSFLGTEKMLYNYADIWNIYGTCSRGALPLDNSTALFTYSLERPNICKRFNQVCRNACGAEGSGWKDFPFKCYWWLLLEALKNLPEAEEITAYLYRGVQLGCSEDIKKEDALIFSQFLSATRVDYVARRFSKSWGVVLELMDVPSSVYRRLDGYANRSDHKEVLFLPFCVFDVVDVRPCTLFTSTTVVLRYQRCLLEEPEIAAQIRDRIGV